MKDCTGWYINFLGGGRHFENLLQEEITMVAYRVGLVGTGYWSDLHLQSWRRAEKADIVALCDRSMEKLYHRAEQYNVPREHCYSSIDDMLRKEKLDIVDIVTAPPSHAELVKKVAAAGKHILCQKPFAYTLKEGCEMVDAKKKAGIRFMVLENWLHLNPFPKIKKMINDGALGNIRSVRYTHKSFFTPLLSDDVTPPQPYFRQMPQLVFTEMGSHWFAIFLHLFGKPRFVTAELTTISPYIKAEDNGVVILTYDDFMLILDCSWATRELTVHQVYDHKIGNHWTENVTIDGDMQTVKLRNVGQYKEIDGMLLVVDDDGRERVIESLQYNQYDANYESIKHFLVCLEDNKPFYTEADWYLNVLRIIDAVYFSAREHRRLEVCWD
jgi:predicted dehydrogenase